MTHTFTVLLLEDSEEDIFLFRRAVTRLARPVVVQPLRDGTSAQNYLLGVGIYAERHLYPQPDLVFSELQIPGVGGFQFLDWLRHHPRLKTLPCIFLSGSTKPGDVERAYGKGVNSFILKPVNFEQWIGRLELIFKFWMAIATRPVAENA